MIPRFIWVTPNKIDIFILSEFKKGSSERLPRQLGSTPNGYASRTLTKPIEVASLSKKTVLIKYFIGKSYPETLRREKQERKKLCSKVGIKWRIGIQSILYTNVDRLKSLQASNPQFLQFWFLLFLQLREGEKKVGGRGIERQKGRGMRERERERHGGGRINWVRESMGGVVLVLFICFAYRLILYFYNWDLLQIMFI